MRLSQFVEMVREAEISTNVVYLRLREIAKSPDKENVGDFLVQMITEDPQRKTEAERLLKELVEGKDPKDVVEEIDDLYRKWKANAKKALPGVEKKVATELRSGFRGIQDEYLKKNSKKLIAAIVPKMRDMIISLAKTVWVYKNYESALHFHIRGDTQVLSGTIYYRPDRSLYRNYRYYVSVRRGPLTPSEKKRELELHQPYSRKTEKFSLPD
jgi:YesN/AraC family two-component response regulator